MSDFKPDALTIHVVSPEKAVNYKWEKNSERLSKSLSIKSIDELNSLPVEIRRKYFQVPSFEEGMVLVLDRINDTYYPITSAKDILPQNKNRAIDHIAALLGAKSIVREIVTRQIAKRQFDASGNIRILKVKAEGSFSEQEKILQEKKYTGKKTFPGNRTEEGYNLAMEYCTQTGLIYDPEIKRMLEDRNPNHPNPISTEEYTVSLTDEVEQLTEYAFSLKYLGGAFSLSAKVSESLENSYEMSLGLKIDYGD